MAGIGMSDKNAPTPLMRQYYEIKQKFPDTLVLFQVGDFYELFFDDARVASASLGIVLTSRGTTATGEPIPLCGVPLHVLDHYLSKLVRAGFKVAICDQLEPAQAGKVVQRGVTQVLTPGLLTDSKLLPEKTASYLGVCVRVEGVYGLVHAELLTGTLYITLIDQDTDLFLPAELSRFMPDELIVSSQDMSLQDALRSQGYVVSAEIYSSSLISLARDWYTRQFPDTSLPVHSTLDQALALLYAYISRNNQQALEQFKTVLIYRPDQYLILDAATQRNLELVKNTFNNSAEHTLFSVLDQAVTSMGSRTIKKWLVRPLTVKQEIEQRLDVVQQLVIDSSMQERLVRLFGDIADVERIVGRCALRRAQIVDYRALVVLLGIVPEFSSFLDRYSDKELCAQLRAGLMDFSPLYLLLTQALTSDPTSEYGLRMGYNEELDRLRTLAEKGTQLIIELERKEQERTGIGSLKIRFNQVYGYGIEVTKPNLSLVPSHYIRTQTLVNRERFTTQELKDLEYDLLRAKNQTTVLEQELFAHIKEQVELWLPALKKLSHSLATVDALLGLARCAYARNYVRPTFNDSRDIIVEQGCHPVVKDKLATSFIPNPVSLRDQESLWIITGPNMGGKSTYLRQVALINIMAQMGSFVPADKASLPILDRIFTRIGAADQVAAGKSTFLVEMEETSLICTQATRNSLVILDEVGRGTSTLDGLAIAQAVLEYIFITIGARCLFATHYHELTVLPEKFPGIVCYHAASTPTEQGVLLLHKIIPGVAQGSFGLEVARRAEIPTPVLERAREILSILIKTEQEHQLSQDSSSAYPLEQENRRLKEKVRQLEQVSIRSSYFATQLDQVTLDELTPRQAFDLVWRLKEPSR